MADYNSSYTGAQIDQRLGWAGTHASRHATGGADAITPAAIGAMAANATPTPAAHKASHATGGADAITPAAIGAAVVGSYTAAIPTSWTGTGPYTQTVAVSGITAADTPIVDVVLSDNAETAEAEQAAYACLSKIVTAANSIVLTCLNDCPETAFNIQLKVVK